MGNTKLIYVEGECEPGKCPTEAQLMEWSRASHGASKSEPRGYLGGRDDRNYFMASLHSYSLAGADVVRHLRAHDGLLHATVVIADLDWSDVKIHHVDPSEYRNEDSVSVYKYAPPKPKVAPAPVPPPPDFQQCAADPRCAGALVCEQPPIGWRFWCREHSPHHGCADPSRFAGDGTPCKVENVVNGVQEGRPDMSKPPTMDDLRRLAAASDNADRAVAALEKHPVLQRFPGIARTAIGNAGRHRGPPSHRS